MKHVGPIFFIAGIMTAVFFTMSHASIRGKKVVNDSPAARSYSTDTESQDDFDLSPEAQELLKARTANPTARAVGKPSRRAEAFVAGPEWEFDGFIAGGQDQQVKSMFATNDLVYLNIGADHGLKPGERLGIFRRGNRVNDPQSGRMLGFEVRKVAIGEVTDLIDTETSSVRVISSSESVEIGDLVRRE
jgi:hypothetical protein